MSAQDEGSGECHSRVNQLLITGFCIQQAQRALRHVPCHSPAQPTPMLRRLICSHRLELPCRHAAAAWSVRPTGFSATRMTWTPRSPPCPLRAVLHPRQVACYVLCWGNRLQVESFADCSSPPMQISGCPATHMVLWPIPGSGWHCTPVANIAGVCHVERCCADAPG